ncbi:hypothetical protein ACQJBY_049881 [Aegilops geniculata]
MALALDPHQPFHGRSDRYRNPRAAKSVCAHTVVLLLALLQPAASDAQLFSGPISRSMVSSDAPDAAIAIAARIPVRRSAPGLSRRRLQTRLMWPSRATEEAYAQALPWYGPSSRTDSHEQSGAKETGSGGKQFHQAGVHKFNSSIVYHTTIF